MHLRPFLSRIVTIAFLLAAPIRAWAQSGEFLIFDFTGGPVGRVPTTTLVFDAAGNLYGTAEGGGVYGYGTAFELTPLGAGVWAPSKIYSFAGGA